MAYEIPELPVPIVPVFQGAPPVTRGMAPPITRGLEPPPLNVPGVTSPTINLPRPPITNPDPGQPRGDDGQNEEAQETADDLPIRPFDASTTVTIPIPIIEQQVTIPVPKPEVVITAGTTAMTAAVTATGAAIFAKPMFEAVMKKLKPLTKKIAKKLLQKKEVSYPQSVECKLPDQLRFEGPRLTPQLSRQHRDRRKEKKGAKKPPSE